MKKSGQTPTSDTPTDTPTSDTPTSDTPASDNNMKIALNEQPEVRTSGKRAGVPVLPATFAHTIPENEVVQTPTSDTPASDYDTDTGKRAGVPVLPATVVQTPTSDTPASDNNMKIALNEQPEVRTSGKRAGVPVLPATVVQTPASVHSSASDQKLIDKFTITRRNLPHWQNPGSVYFITFRSYKGLILDDISRQIIFDNIIHYSKRDYRLFSFVIMPDHVHIILQPNEIENNKYVNLSKIMQEIKGYASKQIIKHLMEIANIEKAQTRASKYVIEQTRASKHVIEQTRAPKYVIEQTQASKYVIEQTRASVLPIKHVFQNESFDRIIRNEQELFEKMNYILNNPVKRGLVGNGYDYKWYFNSFK